jgi:tetratricopeptide (TPR) repeat protein
LRYLDNILEIDEENPKALYKKRDIYERTKNWEALLETQYKILKSGIPEYDKQNEQKNLLGYKYELGRHYLEKGELEKAIKTLKAVIKTDKDFISAYLALAESYISNDNNKEAEKLLIEGYEATSSLVFLVRLEDFFITTGEPGRIIDLYQKAIQTNPNDQKLRFFLAKLYFRLEMIDYAIETVTSRGTPAPRRNL